MLNRNLDINLRKTIKRRGFKLALFPRKYLGMHYNTFNHRLKNDCFHISHLIECMDLLDVSFDELIQEPKDLRIKNTVPKHVKPIIIPLVVPELPTEPTEPVKEIEPVIKKELNHGSNNSALDLIKSLTV